MQQFLMVPLFQPQQVKYEWTAVHILSILNSLNKIKTNMKVIQFSNMGVEQVWNQLRKKPFHVKLEELNVYITDILSK